MNIEGLDALDNKILDVLGTDTFDYKPRFAERVLYTHETEAILMYYFMSDIHGNARAYFAMKYRL